MKSALLIAMLVVSANGFSQVFPAASIMHHPSSISTKDGRPCVGQSGDHLTGIDTDRNFGKMSEPRTPEDRSFIQLNDSIYIWHWDAFINGWTIGYKIVNISYDGNNNLIGEVYQNWDGSVWVNYAYLMYTYDSHNNQISFLRQYWDGSAWLSDFQKMYTYDSNNNQTSYLYQHWDGSVWVNSFQDIYTYDANNNQIGYLNQEWDGSVWVNSAQVNYTYDSNNIRTGYLSQHWEFSHWVNWSKESYAYDSSNNQINNLHQHWNGSSWVNLYLNTYAYDSINNQTSNLFQDWDGSSWKNLYLNTYTYDSNNNQTGNLLQRWWSDIAWVSWNQGTRLYDENNFLRNETTKYFDSAGTIVNLQLPWSPFIIYSDSINYYFHTVTGINDWKVEKDDIMVYPNPNSGKFTIITTGIISSIEIYNIQGDRIFALSKLYHQTSSDIDLSGQGKGLYIINIYDGKKLNTRKVVVQ